MEHTPPEYLRVLVESVLEQPKSIPFEWVLLDNASRKRETRSFLRRPGRCPFIEKNLGIIGGMRFCLEHAENRYILAVEFADYLYPECTGIVTSVIQRHQRAALLCSDENKLVGTRFREPYFKPDCDPMAPAERDRQIRRLLK